MAAPMKHLLMQMRCDNVTVNDCAVQFLPHETFQYSSENIAGPGANEEDFELSYLGCSCNSCEPSGCSCLKFNFPNYERGRLIEHSVDHPIFECNSQCSCQRTCANRIVQFGIQTSLQVFWTAKKGLGLRTKETIPENCFVCEYAGEVICANEAKRRLEKLSAGDCNYILVVRESYSSKVNLSVVDPMYVGNAGRFINHSCDPNLQMEVVRVETAVPKLCLFAKRKISVDEELTYDYGNFSKNGYQSDALPAKECFCGTLKCLKFLPRNDSIFSL